MPTGRMTGGRALAEALALAGAGPMFGMAGFQLLPFYEAVRALGLRHYLINDERTAAFAADAYARVTGRPGICDATLGPGATNLVTGLVESLNAGVPVIAIAGDANRNHAWKNMTQEARQVDILRPCAKELIRIESVARVPELSRARSRLRPRAGPVRSFSTFPKTSRTENTNSSPAIFAWIRRRSRPCPPHSSRCGASRERSEDARAREATDPTRGRRRASLRCLRGIAAARRRAGDPSRAHDERKGFAAMQSSAFGGAVRSLFADRQRADRGVGLHRFGRLQTRRDRDQARRISRRTFR